MQIFNNYPKFYKLFGFPTDIDDSINCSYFVKQMFGIFKKTIKYFKIEFQTLFTMFNIMFVKVNCFHIFKYFCTFQILFGIHDFIWIHKQFFTSMSIFWIRKIFESMNIFWKFTKFFLNSLKNWICNHFWIPKHFLIFKYFFQIPEQILNSQKIYQFHPFLEFVKLFWIYEHFFKFTNFLSYYYYFI